MLASVFISSGMQNNFSMRDWRTLEQLPDWHLRLFIRAGRPFFRRLTSGKEKKKTGKKKAEVPHFSTDTAYYTEPPHQTISLCCHSNLVLAAAKLNFNEESLWLCEICTSPGPDDSSAKPCLLCDQKSHHATIDYPSRAGLLNDNSSTGFHRGLYGELKSG